MRMAHGILIRPLRDCPEAIPLLVGLAVVLPVLGHATWHLYRKVVD